MGRYVFGCLVFVLLPLALQAQPQETTITLRNGSVFTGHITMETDEYLDIQLAQGRIRILKKDVEEREGPAVTGGPAPGPGGGGADPDGPPVRPPLDKDLLARIFARPVKGAAVGIIAGTSATTLSEAPLPRGSPEHAVGSFVSLVIDGRADEAVEEWTDQEALLDSFFPFHAKGLTRYSRRLALESWDRILRIVFADPKLIRGVPRDEIQVRTVRETASVSLVEVAGPVPGEEGGFSHLFTVRDGRIVDFGGLLASLRRVCTDISQVLTERGAGPAILLPLLDRTVDRILELQKSQETRFPRVTLADVAELRIVRRSRPEAIPGSRVTRSRLGYDVTVPPGWLRNDERERPRFADLLIHDSAERAFAMVVVERAQIALTALERAVRANLMAVSSETEIGIRRMVTTDAGDAVRFDATAVIHGLPLRYDFHLIATEKRAYQLICWTLQSDEAAFQPTLSRVIDSFEVGRGEGRSGGGDGTRRPPDGPGPTVPDPPPHPPASRPVRRGGRDR